MITSREVEVVGCSCRLLVCQGFVVSRFPTLARVTRGRLPFLIVALPGNIFINSTSKLFIYYMDRVKRIWYLSPMRAAKVQASLRIRAVSPEPPLLAHTSSESRGTFRQKARSLAPLNGWACAVKLCHDGMLEDTNSLDGAHIVTAVKYQKPIEKVFDNAPPTANKVFCHTDTCRNLHQTVSVSGVAGNVLNFTCQI